MRCSEAAEDAVGAGNEDAEAQATDAHVPLAQAEASEERQEKSFRWELQYRAHMVLEMGRGLSCEEIEVVRKGGSFPNRGPAGRKMYTDMHATICGMLRRDGHTVKEHQKPRRGAEQQAVYVTVDAVKQAAKRWFTCFITNGHIHDEPPHQKGYKRDRRRPHLDTIVEYLKEGYWVEMTPRKVGGGHVAQAGEETEDGKRRVHCLYRNLEHLYTKRKQDMDKLMAEMGLKTLQSVWNELQQVHPHVKPVQLKLKKVRNAANTQVWHCMPPPGRHADSVMPFPIVCMCMQECARQVLGLKPVQFGPCTAPVKTAEAVRGSAGAAGEGAGGTVEGAGAAGEGPEAAGGCAGAAGGGGGSEADVEMADAGTDAVAETADADAMAAEAPQQAEAARGSAEQTPHLNSAYYWDPRNGYNQWLIDAFTTEPHKMMDMMTVLWPCGERQPVTETPMQNAHPESLPAVNAYIAVHAVHGTYVFFTYHGAKHGGPNKTDKGKMYDGFDFWYTHLSDAEREDIKKQQYYNQKEGLDAFYKRATEDEKKEFEEGEFHAKWFMVCLLSLQCTSTV